MTRRRPRAVASRTALVLAFLGLAGPAVAQAEWTARPEPGATPGATRCVLQSERQALPDGYQETWAQIAVDDTAVRVTSASILDPGEGDIGLAVDGGAFVKTDEVTGQRTAVFRTSHAVLIDEFKRGLQVRVQLRFWPTWPKTGIHTATFSLIGFTRAHARMADCRAP